MVNDKSARFLAEFNKLENFLRKKIDAANHETFSRLVDLAGSRKISSVSLYAQDLKSYSDLRNHIVHRDASKTRFVAEPTNETLEGITRLVERVTRPSSVESVMTRSVFSCKRDDLLSTVVKTMGEKIFSAVPVIGNAGEIVGVLTTQSIVNIFSTKAFSSIDSLLVDDALGLKDPSETYEIFARNRLASDALEFFQESSKNGKSPTVILVTQTGKNRESTIGLLTITEIPKIISLLSF
jgi:CBS domain-containing protein